MTADVKITMLGASGAGKTCFLVGMYNIMRLGVQGFTFAAHDPDDDLELSNHYEQMLDSGDKRWPPPTDKPRNYPFAFRHAFKTILSFEWLDYRGGALADRSSEDDVRRLVQQLHDSSCVLLCLSGDLLAGGAARVAVKGKVDRMNLFLGQLRDRVGGRGTLPPVMIVLTKYDVCRGRKKEEVVGFVRQLFNPLFARNSGWLATVCPVSLGLELAQDRDGGEIDPKNVHLPVTFAVYCELKRRAEGKQQTLSSQESQFGQLGGNWFYQWWNREEREKLQQGIQLSRSQLDDLKADMDHITRELTSELQVFYSGEEIEFDV